MLSPFAGLSPVLMGVRVLLVPSAIGAVLLRIVFHRGYHQPTLSCPLSKRGAFFLQVKNLERREAQLIGA